MMKYWAPCPSPFCAKYTDRWTKRFSRYTQKWEYDPAACRDCRQRQLQQRRISKRVRKQVFERHGRRCVYCGIPNPTTIDHVVPIVLGGTKHPDNLVPACRRCNGKKGNKLLASAS